MAQDLKILVAAQLDEKTTLQNLKSAIKKLEKHPTMQAVHLKLNVDHDLTGILQSVNASVIDVRHSFSTITAMNDELNQSLLDTTNQLRSITDEISLQTQAVVQRNLALQQNRNLSLNADVRSGGKDGASASDAFSNVVDDAVTNVGLAVSLSSIPTGAIASAATAGIAGILFTGLTMGIEYLIDEGEKKLQQEQVMIESRIKAARNWTYNEDSIRPLVKEYIDPNTGAERQLEIATELNKLMPELVSYVDEQGQAHLKNSRYLEQELNYAEKLEGLQKPQREKQTTDQFKSYVKEMESNERKLEKTRTEKDIGGYAVSAGIQSRFVKNSGFQQNQLDIQEADFVNKVENSKRLIREYIEQVSLETLKINDIDISGHLADELDTIAHSLDISNLDETQLKEKTDQLAAFFQTLSTAGEHNDLDLTGTFDQLYSLGAELGIGKSKVDDLIVSFYELSLEQRLGVSSAIDFENSQKMIRQTVQELEGGLKPLNQAFRDISQGKSLSAEAMKNLIVLYPQLSTHIKQTTDGWTIEEGVLKNLQKTENERIQKKLTDEKNAASETVNATKERITAYQAELKALQIYNGAKNGKKNPVKFDPYKPYGDFFPNYQDMLKPKSFLDNYNNPQNLEKNAESTVRDREIEAVKERIKQEEQNLKDDEKKRQSSVDALDAILKTMGDPSYGVSGAPKSSKGFTDAPKNIKDTTQAVINGINKEAKARAQLNDLTSSRVQELINEGKYAQGIEKTNTLISDQRKEIKLLEDANKRLQDMQKKSNKNPKYDKEKWLDNDGEETKVFIDLYNNSSKDTQEQLLKELAVWKLLSSAIQTNEEKLTEVGKALSETDNLLKDTKLKNTQLFLNKQNNTYKGYDDALATSQKTQKLFVEGSKEYREEEQKQLEILVQKKNFIESQIQWTNKRLSQGNLEKEQIKELNEYLEENKDRLLDVSIAQQELVDSWKKSVTDAAKNTMDVLEKYYDKQAKLAQDTLDKQLNSYRDLITQQKQLLREQSAAEDYDSQRGKLKNEAQEIQNRINELALDTSQEGNFKRVQAEKELAHKLEEIREMELDRTRELRDQNYDEMLKVKEKEVKSAKELVEKEWQDRLFADKTYSELREALLQNNADKMQNILETFSGNIQVYFDNIGKSIDMNLIDKMSLTDSFNAINTQINKIPNNPNSVFDPKNNDAIVLEQMKRNKELWHTDPKNRDTYYQDNQELGRSIGATFNSKTGIWTGRDGKPLNFHNGGVVGVEGSTTKSWLERLKTSLKQDEVFSILRKGEVVLDKPMRFIQDYTRHIVGSFAGASYPSMNGAVMPGHTYVTIQNLEVAGGQPGVDAFFAALERGKKTRR
ncbi:hypothetical protein [Cohnella boryungensis]|uniref:Phage tail tape measure protein n=1 Tax=Cohnella boryungensis TaxID=768479 RepID=A0ABV8SB24_9BACL